MSAQYLRGDCLEVMKSLPDNSVDLFMCDLPYGCLNASPAEGKSQARIEAAAWDHPINLEAFWCQVERLARNENTVVLHFCNTKFGYDLIASKRRWFRYDLVWDKDRGVSFLLANKQPLRSHEMIYVFSRGAPYFNRIDVDDRCVKSVVQLKRERIVGHPTEKPPALYRWLYERYCPIGGTVLDPTAGSFNSVRTARGMGLHAVGIERDPGFFGKAVERSLEDEGATGYCN